MNWLKRYILGKLTGNELVTYFSEIGIHISFSLKKKPKPRWYARNSRMYRLRREE